MGDIDSMFRSVCQAESIPRRVSMALADVTPGPFVGVCRQMERHLQERYLDLLSPSLSSISLVANKWEVEAAEDRDVTFD
jgi:hypothetical protein